MTGHIWFIGPAVIVGSRLLYVMAKVSRASRSGFILFFRAPLGLRILFGFSISALSFFLIKSIGHEELWIIALGTAMVVFLCLGWPSTITVDQSGVTSQVWWRRKSRIGWGDVVDLEKNAGGDMKVYSSTGSVINFTRYHADPDRFEAEVLRRAKLRRPSMANAPLSINKFTGK